MTTPTATARTTPVGTMLTDGFSTKVTLAADADISFWEKSVQPMGLDGGDGIDVTTMFNVLYRTVRPRSLQTATELTMTVAYDPAVLDQIVTVLNVETTITVNHSNSDTWSFYGFLRQFTPQEVSEGSQPEAEIIITPTNWDSSGNVEAGPNYITSVGTD